MSKKMTVSIEELVEAVREHPVLYDRSCGAVAGHNYNEEKATAWKKISKQLNNSEAPLKAKWRNLRDSYQKALKHRKELEEIGQLYRYTEYKHEDKLSFLFPFVYSEVSKPKKRKHPNPQPSSHKPVLYKIEDLCSDNPENPSVEYLEAEEEEEDDEPAIEEVAISSMREMPMMEDENDLKMEQDEKSFCYLPDDLQSEDPDQTLIDKCLSEETPPISEIDVWLHSIKASMTRLTKLNQARAKRDINAILSNYEIEQLENSST